MACRIAMLVLLCPWPAAPVHAKEAVSPRRPTPATAPATAPATNAAPEAPAPVAKDRRALMSGIVMNFSFAVTRGEFGRAYTLMSASYQAKVPQERFVDDMNRAMSSIRPMPLAIGHAESMLEELVPGSWRYVRDPGFPADVPEAARMGRAMIHTDGGNVLLHVVDEDGKARVVAVQHGGKELIEKREAQKGARQRSR